MKPSGICLSFDDAHCEVWCRISPMLVAAGCRATFFVSGMDALSETDWASLRALQGDGHLIGHHGMAHRRAGEVSMALDDPRRGDPVSYSDFESWIADEITPGFELMAANGIERPRHYSYPYGNCSEESHRALLAIFDTVRTGVKGAGTYDLRTRCNIWGAANFGKRAKDKVCGHEPKVLGLEGTQDLVLCLYMHEPLEHRLNWLISNVKRLGLAWYTPDDICEASK